MPTKPDKRTKGPKRGLTTADLRRTRQPKAPIRAAKLTRSEVRKLAASVEQSRYARINRKQNERPHYGKTLDLDTVDMALQRAARGNMLDITDIGRETLRLDGHLMGLLQKRLNRCGAIGWQIVANDGSGRADFDHGRAKARADFVRAQVLMVPSLRERLMEIAWSVWDNRSCHEKLWEVTSGSAVGDSSLFVGWKMRDLCWVHPRRLSFSQQRRVVITDDYDPGFGFEPKGFATDDLPEKFVVSTPRLFCDYPELEGLSIRCQYWSFFERLGTRERLILMEIFGTPWRLAYSDADVPGGIGDDVMKEAFETLQTMSSRNAAWLPHGVKPQFFAPPAGSGQVHKDAIEGAQYVKSKLVLGNTSSTDAVPTGLGSSLADTQLSEEDLIIACDLMMKADVIEHQITDQIIELNYGPEELVYAPKFQFDLKGVVDRTKGISNLKATLELGAPIALEEVYEVSGFRAPREGEPVVQLVADTSGIPGAAPRMRVVWPPGEAPPPGVLAIEPEEDISLEGEDALPEPPQPPALPPAPAPEEEAEEPAEPVVEASKDEDDLILPAVPFETPSGLSDADREHELRSGGGKVRAKAPAKKVKAKKFKAKKAASRAARRGR